MLSRHRNDRFERPGSIPEAGDSDIGLRGSRPTVLSCNRTSAFRPSLIPRGESTRVDLNGMASIPVEVAPFSQTCEHDGDKTVFAPHPERVILLS